MIKIKKYILTFIITLTCIFSFTSKIDAKTTTIVEGLSITQVFSNRIGNVDFFGSYNNRMSEDYKVKGYYLGNGCKSGCLNFSYTNSMAGAYDEIQVVKMDAASVAQRENTTAACYDKIYKNASDVFSGVSDAKNALASQLSLIVTKGTSIRYEGVSQELNNQCANDIANYNLTNYEGYCKLVNAYIDNYADGSVETAKNYLNGSGGAGDFQNYFTLFLSCKSSKIMQDFIENNTSVFSEYTECNFQKNNSSQTSDNKGIDIDGKDIYVNSINYLNDMYDAVKGINGQTNYVCVGQGTAKRILMSTPIDESIVKSNVGEISSSNENNIIRYCSNMLGTNSNQTSFYRVKYQVGSTTSGIGSGAVSYSCGWNYSTGDSGTINQKFTNVISFDSGKMYINNTSNISKLYASIYLTPSDVRGIGQKNASILNGIAGGITAQKSNAADNATTAEIAIGVAVTALVIAKDAVLTVATGGTYLAGKAIVTAVGGAIVTAVVVGATRIAVPVFETTMGAIGNYNGEVTVNYGNGTSISQAGMSNVSCIANETTTEANIKHDYEVTCDNLMSGKFGEIIDYILNILRFVAIALLIVFSTFDFVKPIVSGDSEELTKSGGKFVKRLIIAVLVFFVPVIVRMLLSLIGRTC